MAEKLTKIALALCVTVTVLCVVCGCSVVVDGVDVTSYVGVQYTTYDYFNTSCSVSCYLPEERKGEFSALWEGEIKSAAAEVDSILSVDGEKSDVAAFNAAGAGETLEINEITYEALLLAKQAYVETDGAFNPALALSVDLYGFSARFNGNDYAPEKPYDRTDPKKELPDEKYVKAFAELSDFSKTEIYEEDGKYFVGKSGEERVVDGVTYTQQLDLSGIGKGYCADLISEIMRENGFVFGYVDVGVSSMSLLKNARREAGADPGEWTVSVLSPVNAGEYYFKAYLKDVSLSTSGSYQQCYEIGGRHYSHIIDPSTGEPYESDVLTVSVYGESAAMCDAYSTAMCVLGSEGAARLAEKLEGYTYTIAVASGNGFSVMTNADGKEI